MLINRYLHYDTQDNRNSILSITKYYFVHTTSNINYENSPNRVVTISTSNLQQEVEDNNKY